MTGLQFGVFSAVVFAGVAALLYARGVRAEVGSASATCVDADPAEAPLRRLGSVLGDRRHRWVPSLAERGGAERTLEVYGVADEDRDELARRIGEVRPGLARTRVGSFRIMFRGRSV